MPIRAEMEAKGASRSEPPIWPAALTFRPKMVADGAGAGDREGMAIAGRTAPKARTATFGYANDRPANGGGATETAASPEADRPMAIAKPSPHAASHARRKEFRIHDILRNEPIDRTRVQPIMLNIPSSVFVHLAIIPARLFRPGVRLSDCLPRAWKNAPPLYWRAFANQRAASPSLRSTPTPFR